MIRSPLRYPGGKSRAVQRLLAFVPATFHEYREPFVGGGSFFLALRQRYPDVAMWINDINPDLFFFWICAQRDSDLLAREIMRLKVQTTNGKALFLELRDMNTDTLTDMERAVRFFVLNRISFSGLAEAGGFSESAFTNRFTHASIARVAELSRVLEGVTITNADYKDVLKGGDERTFTFLDPPYLVSTTSRLYGRNGIWHTQFDHVEFAAQMKTCAHTWIITYDDSPEIRHNFRFASMECWDVHYGMTNVGQSVARKGRELIIMRHPYPRDMAHAMTTWATSHMHEASSGWRY